MNSRRKAVASIWIDGGHGTAIGDGAHGCQIPKTRKRLHIGDFREHIVAHDEHERVQFDAERIRKTRNEILKLWMSHSKTRYADVIGRDDSDNVALNCIVALQIQQNRGRCPMAAHVSIGRDAASSQLYFCSRPRLSITHISREMFQAGNSSLPCTGAASKVRQVREVPPDGLRRSPVNAVGPEVNILQVAAATHGVIK